MNRNVWQCSRSRAVNARPGRAAVRAAPHVRSAEGRVRGVNKVVISRIESQPRNISGARRDARPLTIARERLFIAKDRAGVRAGQHDVGIVRGYGDGRKRTLLPRGAGLIPPRRAARGQPQSPPARPQPRAVARINRERRDVNEARVRNALVGRGESLPAVRRFSDQAARRGRVNDAWVGRVYCNQAAVAAEHLPPAVDAFAVRTLQKSVAARARQIARPVWMRHAVIKLRRGVTAVERSPSHDAVGGIAGRGRSRRGRGKRINGFVDSAVARGEHRPVARGVVPRVKDNRVMMAVRVLRRVRVNPRIRGQPPIRAAVVGSEQINAADPDAICVHRINRNRIGVPPRVEQTARADSAIAEKGVLRPGKQHGVEFCRVAFAHLRRPGVRVAARRRTKDRVQAGLIASRRIRRSGVDDVLVRRGKGQRCPPHPRIVQHFRPRARTARVGVAENLRLGERPARSEKGIRRLIVANDKIETSARGRRVERSRPVRSAVNRAPHAGARRRINATAVGRADHDVVDVMKIRSCSSHQPRPGQSSIRAFEDARAANRVEVEEAFARARVKHVRVVAIHRQRIDRDVGDHVGQRFPACSAVGRLPHPARSRRRVHRVVIRRMDDQGPSAPADVARAKLRPDRAGFGLRSVQIFISRRRITRHPQHPLAGFQVTFDRNLLFAFGQSFPQVKLRRLVRRPFVVLFFVLLILRFGG